MSIVNSHSFNRTYLYRFACGKIASQDTGCDNQKRRSQRDVDIYRRVQENCASLPHVLPYASRLHRTVDQLRQSDAAQHADVPEDSRNQQRLGDNQPQDGGRFRPDCLADTELFRPFAHRYEHDVADAHNAGNQSADADHPDEKRNAVHDVVHHPEVIRRVPKPDGVVVGRIELVQTCHDRTEALFEIRICLFRDDALQCERKTTESVALVIQTAGGGKRNVGRRVVILLVVVVEVLLVFEVLCGV